MIAPDKSLNRSVRKAFGRILMGQTDNFITECFALSGCMIAPGESLNRSVRKAFGQILMGQTDNFITECYGAIAHGYEARPSEMYAQPGKSLSSVLGTLLSVTPKIRSPNLSRAGGRSIWIC